MKNAKQLQEIRGERVSALDEMVKLTETEGREFTAEEVEASENIMTELEDLDKQISRAEKLEDALKATAAPVAFATGSGESNERAKIQKRFSITEGIKGAMNHRLEGVAAEMDSEARREALECGVSVRGDFNIPSWLAYGQRTAYGVDGGGDNAHVSGSGVQVNQSEIAMSLQSKSVLANAGVSQLSGFAGDVDLPVMPGNAATLSGGNAADDTEANAITPGTTAFSRKTLKPTRVAAAVDVSKNLMYSVNGNLDDLFGRDLGAALASKMDHHVLNGVIADLESAGRIALGTIDETGDPATMKATNFADIARLEGVYLQGNPDNLRPVFCMTPAVMAFLKGQTADAGGFMPAVGNIAGGASTIMGHAAYHTTQIDALTGKLAADFFGDADANDTLSSVSPIIMADASDIFLCTWAGISVSVDPYTENLKGVVRIVADAYFDGKIRRNGSGAILAGLTSDLAATGIA